MVAPGLYPLSPSEADSLLPRTTTVGVYLHDRHVYWHRADVTAALRAARHISLSDTAIQGTGHPVHVVRDTGEGLMIEADKARAERFVAQARRAAGPSSRLPAVHSAEA